MLSVQSADTRLGTHALSKYGERNINVLCTGSISFLHTFHPKWWLMPMRGHKRRRLLVLWDNPFITTNWCVIPKWNLHGRLRLIEGRVRVHQIIHDSCSALIRPVCLSAYYKNNNKHARLCKNQGGGAWCNSESTVSRQKVQYVHFAHVRPAESTSAGNTFEQTQPIWLFGFSLIINVPHQRLDDLSAWRGCARERFFCVKIFF